ncbi:MAG: hypothetical protein ABIL05_05045, partial [candidate division WOR-3 bacterium]
YNDHRHFGSGRVNFSYTMFKFIEVNGFVSATVRYDQKTDVIGIPSILRKDVYSYGWTGYGGGLKVGHHLVRNEEKFFATYLGGKIGIEAGMRMPKRDTALVNRGFPRVYGHESDIDYRLLMGIEFGALGINANIGRINTGASWNSKVFREDKIFYGLTGD